MRTLDDHRAVFDSKSLVDLVEIVGPIDSETLGAKSDGQFFEIGLSNFGIFLGDANQDMTAKM